MFKNKKGAILGAIGLGISVLSWVVTGMKDDNDREVLKLEVKEEVLKEIRNKG